MDLCVDRRAYGRARLSATAACCGTFLCNTSLRRFVTRSGAGLAHFRAQFADVSGVMRLAHYEFGTRLANLGAVFRRLDRPRIHAAARLERDTAFLALSTSVDALLHFLRNSLVCHGNPSGI
ncbi:MAG: hypothetical protein ACR2IV_01830 [Bryobacteraceae bacterium]